MVAWYEEAMRWAQINIREHEPPLFDAPWWGDYLERCRIDAVVVNAGGIVAYYPTEEPLHRKSRFLGDRDLLGDLVEEMKRRDIRVLGRFTLTRQSEQFFYAHPGWFGRRSDGSPMQDYGYRPCINGPWFREYAPGLVREVMSRYPVDGIFSNLWLGAGHCFCANCRRRFREDAGEAIPEREDRKSPLWRRYRDWRFERILDFYRMMQGVVKGINPEATWMTNMHAFEDNLKAIAEMADVVQLEAQGRTPGSEGPLWLDAEQGRYLRSVSGGKPCTVVFGIYNAGQRMVARTEAELRIWSACCMASGARPWFHVIGGVQEDRRALPAAEAVFRRHADHEDCYRGLESVADVGVVYSERTSRFLSRSDRDRELIAPLRGTTLALMRAGIPFDLVYGGDLSAGISDRYRVLVLPNVVCMSDAACRSVSDYVRNGGGLVASLQTAWRDEQGDLRERPGLEETLGAKATGDPIGPLAHAYARIEERGDIGSGFEGASVLMGPVYLAPVAPATGARVPLTLIPPVTVMPPEASWPEVGPTETPVVVASGSGEGRCVYFAGDLDRRYWEERLPDHGRLLANAVEWAGRGAPAVQVDAPGIVDVHPYVQDGGRRLVVHLVNLSHPNLHKGPLEELTPIGPVRVRVRADLAEGAGAECVFAGQTLKVGTGERYFEVCVERLVDYEIVRFTR